MLFNTMQYGIFFAVVLVVYWILPRRIRPVFLLLASYYFYASAIHKYLLLILGLTVFNYAISFWLARAEQPMRKRVLWLAIGGNLASLSYFKYSQLIVSSTQPILRHLPLLGPLFHDPLTLNILLPLGISFFTFEFIHYQAEIYKGFPPVRSFVDFALFPAFFPTQIAGPIKRIKDWKKQLEHPIMLREVDVDGAIGLILRGLVKKVIVADNLSPIIAQIFATPAKEGWATVWFAIFAFATQIYCDFSGYTDIGRGCAMLLGYSVPENFDRPYQSANPGEFWHRWHMSLSSWLRDYLYIPLGGSRVSASRIYLNLMITMALGGLWHGAQWHYMVWGVYQGILLCVHRFWSRSVGKTATYQSIVRFPIAQLITRACTLVLVCVGWLLFRADSVTAAFQMLQSGLNFSQPALAGFTLSLTSTPVILMGIAAAIVGVGWLWAIFKDPIARVWRKSNVVVGAARYAFAVSVVARPVLYTLAISLLILWPPHASARFIYFQF